MGFVQSRLKRNQVHDNDVPSFVSTCSSRRRSSAFSSTRSTSMRGDTGEVDIEQIDLIRSHWKDIFRGVHNSQQETCTVPIVAFSGLFIKRLFELAPETEKMFYHTQTVQKVIQMVGLLVKLADNTVDSDSLARHAAESHAIHGISVGHFDICGTALLETLAECSGSNWTDELETAWMDLYRCAYVKITTKMNQIEQGCSDNYMPVVVLSKQSLTPDVFEITLRLRAPIQFKPGQCVHLGLPVSNNLELQRHYMITNDTDPSQQHREIQFVVKRVGIASKWMHGELEVGQQLKLYSICEKGWIFAPEKNFLLVSGGIGIVSMISLIRTMYRKRTRFPHVRVRLVHFAHSQKNLIFHDELFRMMKEWDGFTVEFKLSLSNLSEWGLDFYSKLLVRHPSIKNIVPMQYETVFVSGPETFKHHVSFVLRIPVQYIQELSWNQFQCNLHRKPTDSKLRKRRIQSLGQKTIMAQVLRASQSVKGI